MSEIRQEYGLAFSFGQKGRRVVTYGSKAEAELYATKYSHATIVVRSVTVSDWEPCG